MIITISGKPGSGKSTVARILAKKLRYKHYSTGEFHRELARKKGITMLELAKLLEKDKRLEKYVDDYQIRLGKEEDNFVMDSRLGFHFIPESFKVFLNVSEEEAAKRVYLSQRKDEKENSSLKETLKNIRERAASERRRFKKYYGLSIGDRKHYDLYIDSSHESAESVADQIIRVIHGTQGNKENTVGLHTKRFK